MHPELAEWMLTPKILDIFVEKGNDKKTRST